MLLQACINENGCGKKGQKQVIRCGYPKKEDERKRGKIRSWHILMVFWLFEWKHDKYIFYNIQSEKKSRAHDSTWCHDFACIMNALFPLFQTVCMLLTAEGMLSFSVFKAKNKISKINKSSKKRRINLCLQSDKPLLMLCRRAGWSWTLSYDDNTVH